MPDPGTLLSFAGECTLTAADGESGGGSGGGGKRVSIVAYTGGMMQTGGWGMVAVELSGVELPDQIPLLADHDNRLAGIAGHGKPEVRGGKLMVDGSIITASDAGKQIIALSGAGLNFQASVGAVPTEARWISNGEVAKVNGKDIKAPTGGGFYHIIKAQLREVSLVAIGADRKTKVSIAATAATDNPAMPEGNAMNFEKWLTAKGFDPKTISEQQKVTLQAAYDAEQTPPPAAPVPAPLKAAAPVVDDLAPFRAARAAELERVAAVEVAAKGFPEIQAKAVREGWDQTRTELEVLRASRNTNGPQVLVRSGDSGATPQVLEAALCLGAGIGDQKFLLASYGEQALNQADKYRRSGVRRIAQLAAAQSGVALPDTVDSSWIRAAFSTTNLGGILGNVANKALGASFLAVRAAVPRIARKASHQNFHSHTVYSMALNGDMEEVAPTGELQHFNASEESYTRQVKTRGGILRITRNDLINDELGAFAQAAQMLGRKAAVAREKACFTKINATGAGSSFFTAARGNYFDGAATTLQISSLSTAVQMFRDMKGKDNDPTMIEPRLLLVPTALEETAKALMDRSAVVIATALGSTSASKREPAVNVWAGAFEPVVSEWLSASSLTGYSSTAWYLLADPNDVPAIEVSYLNGNENPVVEFFGLDSEANTLGVTWRAYFDFGVDLAEYRAGVKSKGAA
jgi:hypothetical protein